MKSSNLAQRLDLEEPETPAMPVTPARAAPELPLADAARAPRPRRSPGFRAIVLRDQGFEPFRVT